MFQFAKLRISENKSKFWNSECKEKLAYSLLSRDKIRFNPNKNAVFKFDLSSESNFGAAKLRISENKSKFWNSECKEKLVYSLLSRDKIRFNPNFGTAIILLCDKFLLNLQ